MIAYLKGKMIQKSPDQIIMDIGGVGYHAWIPLSTYLNLGEVHETVELFIYTQLTDNSLSLYGFSTKREKELFQKLIAISGIGPKIALNILSGIESSDLEKAIKESNITRISMIPGIGKKTAMRIALELQEKLDRKEKIIHSPDFQEKENLISALMNMGFKRKEVEKTVEHTIQVLTPEAGFEKLLRESLKKLSRV